jgi:transcription elongation factor GreA
MPLHNTAARQPAVSNRHSGFRGRSFSFMIMETSTEWPPFHYQARRRSSSAELHKLKTVERPWVINAIAEARAQGDLSENAEYDAAKDRQGFIEGRIQEIEQQAVGCADHRPVHVDAGGKVVFGATVELEDEDSRATRSTYQIVGEDEADLKKGLINISSPIARALIGKEEGDTAEVQAACGVLLLAVYARSKCGQSQRQMVIFCYRLVAISMLAALLVEFGVAPRILAREDLRLWHTVGSALYALQWLCTGLLLWCAWPRGTRQA